MSGKQDSGDIRIRSAEAASLVTWSLPEVSGSHLVALETKKTTQEKAARCQSRICRVLAWLYNLKSQKTL